MAGEIESADVDFDVIVIGAGVAGCVTAYQLAVKGHSVLLVERGAQPGSKNLSGGIFYCRAMKSLGVDFRTNWVGGKTVTVPELLESGFKAVFIGVGAGLPVFLGIPGENLIGVFSANEYLTRVNLGRAYKFPVADTPYFPAKRVVVFGGGNVAMASLPTAISSSLPVSRNSMRA